MKFWMVAGHMETSSLGLPGVEWSKTTALAGVFLPYAHHLLSQLIWSIFYDLGLVWIPLRSVKIFHKTVYKMVKPL